MMKEAAKVGVAMPHLGVVWLATHTYRRYKMSTFTKFRHGNFQLRILQGQRLRRQQCRLAVRNSNALCNVFIGGRRMSNRLST